MDGAYLSVVSALAGSAIGGLTSLTATWLSQHVQFSTQQRAGNRTQRIELYKSFIDEASKRYADAFAHDRPDVSNLVDLYALVSRMRILSSRPVIEKADAVVRAIIETYLAPNRTFRDLEQILDNESLNPLKGFSAACRVELRGADPT